MIYRNRNINLTNSSYYYNSVRQITKKEKIISVSIQIILESWHQMKDIFLLLFLEKYNYDVLSQSIVLRGYMLSWWCNSTDTTVLLTAGRQYSNALLTKTQLLQTFVYLLYIGWLILFFLSRSLIIGTYFIFNSPLLIF